MPQIDIVSVTITHEIYGKNKKRALPNVMDLKWTTQNFLHLSPPKYFPSHSFTYTVFGWGENLGRKIEWKTMFSTVWQTRENREERKPGRKFSLPGPQIFSSQIGRKSLKRKCSLGTFIIMPSGIK